MHKLRVLIGFAAGPQVSAPLSFLYPCLLFTIPIGLYYSEEVKKKYIFSWLDLLVVPLLCTYIFIHIRIYADRHVSLSFLIK